MRITKTLQAMKGWTDSICLEDGKAFNTFEWSEVMVGVETENMLTGQATSDSSSTLKDTQLVDEFADISEGTEKPKKK